MKKVLLSTSVGVASLCAASLGAAEWDINLGGFYTAHIGYSQPDVNGFSGNGYDGIDTVTDGEIYFKPEITLDNGLKLSAHVELETSTSGDQIDESFLSLKGSFGEVEIGSTNSVGYKMHYAAPHVSLLNYGEPESLNDLVAYVPVDGVVNTDLGSVNTGDDFYRGTLGTTHLENASNNDAERINYTSPTLSGFVVGVSYARDGNQDNFGRVNCDSGRLCDAFDVALRYAGEFGAIRVAASARWGTFNRSNSSDDPEVTGFGVNLGFDNFTVGGSFAEQKDSAADDGEAYDLGVAYDNPENEWSYSATYFNGENVDDENLALNADEEFEAFVLAARYDYHKHVAVSIFLADVQFKEDVGDVGGTSAGNDVDGFVIGTGIGLSF